MGIKKGWLMDIVCLGEVLIDMFPVETGRKLAAVTAFLPKPGGAPANVAVASSKLGKRSAFIGKVGEDAFGHHLAEVLSNEGVDISGIRFAKHARTTMAFIAMPDEYSAEFVFYRNPGADLLLKTKELDLKLLQNTKAFHFGSLSLVADPARSATLEAVKIAKTYDSLISFDVNYRPSLWDKAEDAVDQIWSMIPLVDSLKINEVELNLLAGDIDIEAACNMLLSKGPQLIVVTLGADGSHFHTRNTSGNVSAFHVETVDATGCGDAFMSGLLSRLTEGESWHSHLNNGQLRKDFRFASAVGALTAEKKGVIPALPDQQQVIDFLRKQ
ncbi:MAG: hypothetical protein JEZ06_19030 [Anaerolineaceae bacterium]|nr:hypothetical protein [Anaerolineaceae bacterium]